RRQSDVTIRQALGASRTRLTLEALAEASVLAILGGMGGIIIAAAATPLLVAFSPADVPRLEFVAVNTRALGVAVGTSVLVALASALAPISLLGRGSSASLARTSARRVIFGRSPAGAALVVAEIALAVLVLVAAGLVGRSFVKLR